MTEYRVEQVYIGYHNGDLREHRVYSGEDRIATFHTSTPYLTIDDKPADAPWERKSIAARRKAAADHALALLTEHYPALLENVREIVNAHRIHSSGWATETDYARRFPQSYSAKLVALSEIADKCEPPELPMRRDVTAVKLWRCSDCGDLFHSEADAYEQHPGDPGKVSS